MSKPEAEQTYGAWLAVAEKDDQDNGLDEWRKSTESKHYDSTSIAARLETLRSLRTKKDAPGLIFALNEGLHGNIGGMANPLLYDHAKAGTKQLIVDYVDEVVSTLKYLANPRLKQVSVGQKLEFFDRASHCFGRSALLMSGAGSLFYFHVGVVKALWEQDILPKVISGASGGALVAAIVGTRSPKDLRSVFDPAYVDAALSHEVALRSRVTFEAFRDAVVRLIPDLTFLEAQQLSGLEINIPVTPATVHQKSRLLNATTTPNVLIRESVLASCAVPGVYPAVTLQARTRQGRKAPYLPKRQWIDGAIAEELPLKRLSRLYGINHTIVSQTNPLVLPFVSAKERQSIVDIVQDLGVSTAKQWSLALLRLAAKPARSVSIANQTISTYQSLLSQSYTGDITILPPTRVHNPLRLLTRRSPEEAKVLIATGERATWPKIEQIRVQTKVSRALAAIRKKYSGHRSERLVDDEADRATA